MRDIYEAIEKLSVVLSLRIENAVRKRGWAGKPNIERFEVAAPDRSVYPARVSLQLPLGSRAVFAPDENPSADQTTWSIQVRRSDGILRASWASGFQVRKTEGGYQLFARDELLSEPLFKQILDELAGSGLTGHALTISKAYASRFGMVPAAVYEVLYSAQYVEQLELMHEAVLTGASQLEVESELGRLCKWEAAT